MHAYLIRHDHGRATVNPQDGYQRLRGNKIQNLGDGFLVGAVAKHHAVDLSPGHEVADMSDDALRIRFIDQQRDHVDVDRVVLAPQGSDVPVRDVTRLAQDHGNVQNGNLLSSVHHAHQGEESRDRQECQAGKPHSAQLYSLLAQKENVDVYRILI